MRKVIVSMINSLDGYCEGPGKDVMAMPFDGGFSPYNVQRLRAATTQLYGRRSYEGALSYWPTVVDDPRQDDTEHEISQINNAIEKVVISDTLSPDQTGVWASTTRIVRRADAHEAVAELRAGDGGDIIMFGGATTWNDLLAAGLVDELHVLVGPALIGGGTRMFDVPGRIPLTLLESRTLPDSRLVLLRYAPGNLAS